MTLEQVDWLIFMEKVKQDQRKENKSDNLKQAFYEADRSPKEVKELKEKKQKVDELLNVFRCGDSVPDEEWEDVTKSFLGDF